MSQRCLQELEKPAPQLDFAVINECSGFDSHCLGEIRVAFYSCTNGLLVVSERHPVELPIARVFDLTTLDVFAKIGRRFEVILDVETGEFFLTLDVYALGIKDVERRGGR